MEADEKYWHMQDGTRVPIKAMTESHINNCIVMLRRAIMSRPNESMYGEPEGEMAQDAFNAEIRHNNILEESMRKQIVIFEKELESRR